MQIMVTHFNYDDREKFLGDLEKFHSYWVANEQALHNWKVLFTTFGDSELKEVSVNYQSFDELKFFCGEDALIQLYNDSRVVTLQKLRQRFH